MHFVEFLEMIARVAEIKFKGSDKALEPLHVKLIYVFDEMIPKILGREVHRREPDEAEASSSESESEY